MRITGKETEILDNSRSHDAILRSYVTNLEGASVDVIRDSMFKCGQLTTGKKICERRSILQT
jgi:hypothetical protein